MPIDPRPAGQGFYRPNDMVESMSPRHLPRTAYEGRAGKRPDNPPFGPTGPSPDRVRRLQSERHHPALFLRGTANPPVPPGHPGYRLFRHPHPLVTHRPLPPPVHDPDRRPHHDRTVDPEGRRSLRVESPYRPPMRLTRDGRMKARDFGRRP